MPLKLNSTGGGSVTLDTPSTASTFTLTVPAITGTAVVTGSTGTVSTAMITDGSVTQAKLSTGVAGNGPAFSAYQAGNQAVSNNTNTKISINTENFDTANYFDTSTYRYTPQIAGYYYFYGLVSGGGSVNTQLVEAVVYKNGSQNTNGIYVYAPTYVYAGASSNTSAFLYMNGTTDYVELYGRVAGSGTLSIANGSFFGALVRAA